MTRYYDQYGKRVPSPRNDHVPSNSITLFVLLFLVIMTIAFGVISYRHDKKVTDTKPVITHDSMTAIHTYDGQMIRFYVMTDPDTNIQYIINDRGGMCVREHEDAN